MLLLARLIHIFVGVFWAGTMIFNAWLLLPALKDLGPDAGRVMGGLAKRGFLVIMPVAGILTITGLTGAPPSGARTRATQ